MSRATAGQLTSVDILLHLLRDDALGCNINGLDGQFRAVSSDASAIHGALQRVALPAKHVVAVLTKTRRVAGAEHEGLSSVLWPLVLVIEGCGIPSDDEVG